MLRVLAPGQVLVPFGLRGQWAQLLQGPGGEPAPGRTPGCKQQGDGEEASPASEGICLRKEWTQAFCCDPLSVTQPQ